MFINNFNLGGNMEKNEQQEYAWHLFNAVKGASEKERQKMLDIYGECLNAVQGKSTSSVSPGSEV
jgi:hypothetical protein